MSWFKSTNKPTTADGRAAERVDWSPEASLEVKLVTREGELIDVQWVDLSVSGVKLIVPDEMQGELREGYPIKLAFAADGVSFRVNGRIIWVHLELPEGAEESGEDAEQERESIGVRFAYVDPALGDEHPELWAYFNRRTAYRVKAPADEPIEVEVEGQRGTLTARMFDISATGIALLLPKETRELPWVEKGLGHKFDLVLQLSGEYHTMRLRARVERVDNKPRGLFWGLSFLEEDERELGEELEAIADYVMARQRQMQAPEEQ